MSNGKFGLVFFEEREKRTFWEYNSKEDCLFDLKFGKIGGIISHKM